MSSSSNAFQVCLDRTCIELMVIMKESGFLNDKRDIRSSLKLVESEP